MTTKPTAAKLAASRLAAPTTKPAELADSTTSNAEDLTIVPIAPANLVEGTSGDDTLQGTAGDDEIRGLEGNDNIAAGDGNDSIDGGAGDDTIDAGNGNDNISETAGRNTINGGAGEDFLFMTFGDSGITFNYTDVNNGTTSTGDKITGIENLSLTGGKGNDVINASAATNVYAFGGEGNDNITGGNGDDFLEGGDGDDTLNGGNGNDYLSDTVGQNTIDGGAGEDTLSLSGGTTDVTVTYTDVNNGTTSTGDRFKNIENLNFFGGKGTNDTVIATAATTANLNGGDGNDNLTGSNGNDFLYGNIGNDTIDGGAGDDNISGGDDFDFEGNNPAEVDILTGGAGKDSFSLSLGNNQLYSVGGNNDYARITDFNPSEDVVQLWGGKASDYTISANTAVPGVTGAALFRGTELVAIFENAAPTSLDLNAAYFEYQGREVTILEGDPAVTTVAPNYKSLTATAPKPVISIAAGTNAQEGGAQGSFNLTRDGDLSQTLTVNLSAPTGTATSGTDYQNLPTTVTFAAGESQATVVLSAIDDSIYEGKETVTLGIVNGNNYQISSASGSATIELLDNEAQPIIGTMRGDSLVGGELNDRIEGRGGHDRILGNAGNDILDGGRGRDALLGGEGNDTLIGGLDDDVLTGGEGADRFVFGASGTNLRALGTDHVKDFNRSQGDRIVLDRGTFAKLQSAVGDGFSVGTEFAVVNSDREASRSKAAIVYNQSNGNLFYNQNGSNFGLGHDGGVIATFDRHPTLSAGDFIIS
jgi:Ca2+-binding RTX toxin-like protein